MRGGIAERGGVRVGHRIIEINSQSVVATPHEKIVHILSNAVGEVRERLKEAGPLQGTAWSRDPRLCGEKQHQMSPNLREVINSRGGYVSLRRAYQRLQRDTRNSK